VQRRSQPPQEERLPDPSQCAVTISDDCRRAQARCLEMLPEERRDECFTTYPAGSQIEVEIGGFLRPSLCTNTFSYDCNNANRQCTLYGGSTAFCNAKYPANSNPNDFLILYPPSVCGDPNKTAKCEEFGRICAFNPLPANFCEIHYPQPPRR
jgi:hypothetical protein